MKNVFRKFFPGIFFLFLIYGNNIFAYSIDTSTQKQASEFVRQINKKLVIFPNDKAEKLRLLIHQKLLQLQNSFIGKTSSSALQKNALYESVRRKLFTDSFETKEVIFDDGVGAIWTHAPKGFGILYNPTETPTI